MGAPASPIGTYPAAAHVEVKAAAFLDFLISSPTRPATSRLYLHQSVTPVRPENYLSNLRFHFDAEHDAAAAVMLLIDRNDGDEVLAWMTRGATGREGVFLTHDSWNEDERRFPSHAIVTIDELRELVAQWAFGEVLPPPAVGWSVESPGNVGWF